MVDSMGNHNIMNHSSVKHLTPKHTGRGGHDRIIVGFTTTCVISGFHH
jgi:hypothetical protein